MLCWNILLGHATPQQQEFILLVDLQKQVYEERIDINDL
jgi:hypothetical protein